MALNNPWVGYLDRSYQQIKESLLTKLSTSNPEITDHSENNILVVIVSMFAGLVEMLNYYIDNMAREAFISTARKFTSMVRLVKLLDYRIKASNPSSADIIFTFNNPTNANSVIPSGTIVSTSNGIEFLTISNVNIPMGTSSISAGVLQYTQLSNQNLGTTSGVANEVFPLGQDYVDSSAEITIDSEIYTRVNSLGLSSPTSKHFIVEIDVDNIAYVVFGNGTNGIIPPSNKSVIANYRTTMAEDGNVEVNAINTLVSNITLPGVSTITINNPLPSSGGTSYEDIDSIRVNAPLSIRTLDRAVTRQDYIDITRLAPGVGKSEVYYECGKNVEIYIIPSGGGIAQTPLLNSVKDFVDARKMITTFITTLPAGESYLKITLDVLAKFRANPVTVKSDVENALVSYGSFEKQNINKSIKISDIISVVDNLTSVESLDLIFLAKIPYPRPVSHYNPLLWLNNTTTNSTTKVSWKLEYSSLNTFNVFKNTAYIGQAFISSPFSDDNNIFEFTIQPSTYTIGEVWEFTTYPVNKNIIIDDFTMPRIQVSDLTINVTEQLTQPII